MCSNMLAVFWREKYEKTTFRKDKKENLRFAFNLRYNVDDSYSSKCSILQK